MAQETVRKGKKARIHKQMRFEKAPVTPVPF